MFSIERVYGGKKGTYMGSLVADNNYYIFIKVKIALEDNIQ